MKKIKQYIKNRQALTIVLSILFLVLGTTFAWLTWSSSYTNLNLVVGNIGEVIYTDGQDISIYNIGPVLDYNDGSVTKFSVKKIISDNAYITVDIAPTFLPDELKDASFKCVILSSIDNINWVEEVNDFNFSEKEISQNYMLLLDEISTSIKYYKLIIYMDGNMLNPTNMQGKTFEATINVEIKDSYIKEYAYTGGAQTFTAPQDGYYQVELWGAQGGTNTQANAIGGKGAYTSGKLPLTKGETIYVYVGGQGNSVNGNTDTYGGWNGGGGIRVTSFESINDSYNGTGGGATDIALVSSSVTQNPATLRYERSIESYISRLMVAGGGGGGGDLFWTRSVNGGAGGNLVGESFGGAQTSSLTPIGNGILSPASFGLGGTANGSAGASAVVGGGGGYYGGAHSQAWVSIENTKPSGGGSSYISGYAGVNSVDNNTTLTHNNKTEHYSGKYFIDGIMQSGINEGNGKVKFTYIGETHAKANTKLNNVRYIKDCANGNTMNDYTQWVEVQAIKEGSNLALNKVIEGTTGIYENNNDYSYSFALDGMMDNMIALNRNFGSTDNTGLNCVTVDLGSGNNLDEIAVWHYWYDGRTYYGNTTYVSSDKTTWIPVKATSEQETSIGKRFNSWNSNDNVVPVFRVTNLIENGDFENGSTGWNLPAKGFIRTADNGDAYFINEKATQYTSAWRGATKYAVSNHKYYMAYFAHMSGTGDGVCYNQFDYYYDNQDHYYTWIPQLSYNMDERRSQIATAPDVSGTVGLVFVSAVTTSTNGLQNCTTDDIVVIDLTDTFGVGNEPTKAWCDAHLRYQDEIYFNGSVEKHFSMNDKFIFPYVNDAQIFVAPKAGTYQIELWGAGNYYTDAAKGHGAGGYVSGTIDLALGETIYVYVGGRNNIFNGGGVGGIYQSGPTFVANTDSYGHGATDVRLIGGNWDSFSGLSSRIMVAGAGGSGNYATLGSVAGVATAQGGYGFAGGLSGYEGLLWYNSSYLSYIPYPGLPGTQMSGGSGGKNSYNNTYGGSGTFGKGGVGGSGASILSDYTSSTGYGGSGGYYGSGGSGGINSGYWSPGGTAGGSSYISGHTGCVAIKKEDVQEPKDGCSEGTSNRACSIHYSTREFTDTLMIDGYGIKWQVVDGTLIKSQQAMPAPLNGIEAPNIGHSGNGYAQITYIEN